MGSGLSQTASKDPVFQDALSKIADTFDAYDKNHDGILSKNEFLTIVAENIPPNTTIPIQEREQWFVQLDTNNDGVIDKNEFIQWWNTNNTNDNNNDNNNIQRRNSTLNRMEAVRTNLANKRGIFLGFTYSEFKKSKLLDPTQVRKWKPKEVMLYLASRSELNVLRSELDRDVWNDIDGETLLELEAEDLVAKKIKKYRKVLCFSFCFCFLKTYNRLY